MFDIKIPRIEPIRRAVFLSDNCAPACAEVIDAIATVNVGSEESYGDDAITAKASAAMRRLFHLECETFFVSSGVAANALSLAAVCPPYRSIICHEHAHVNKDECGAIPFFTGGGGLLPCSGNHFKLTPKSIRAAASSRRDIHCQQPAAVTITQATEAGTVYSIEELYCLSETIKDLGLHTHVDGARLANAAAYLNAPMSSIVSAISPDIISFGGSKNGLHLGEAIIICNPKLVEGFRSRIKQTGHLISKTRFLSAGWLALLNDDLWLANAKRANDAAQYLAQQLANIREISIAYPCQANFVMIDAARDVIAAITAGLCWSTHRFACGETLRFVCSWCTSANEIDWLVNAVSAAIATTRAPQPGDRWAEAT